MEPLEDKKDLKTVDEKKSEDQSEKPPSPLKIDLSSNHEEMDADEK